MNNILSNPYIDELLKTFKDHAWAIKECEFKIFHQHKWPDIVISNDSYLVDDSETQKNLGDNFWGNIELLGEYNCFGNDSKEGKIILYVNTIDKHAERIIKSKSLPFSEKEKITNNLITIVLIHEFVHWLMHWVESPKLTNNQFLSRKFIPFNYKEQHEKEFHEYFAQLFAYLSIKSNPEILFVFEALELNQSSIYKTYKFYLECGINNFNTSIKLLTYLREISCQSYEVIKNMFAKDKHSSLKGFELYDDFNEVRVYRAFFTASAELRDDSIFFHAIRFFEILGNRNRGIQIRTNNKRSIVPGKYGF